MFPSLCLRFARRFCVTFTRIGISIWHSRITKTDVPEQSRLLRHIGFFMREYQIEKPDPREQHAETPGES
jgi:hypothetical protein